MTQINLADDEFRCHVCGECGHKMMIASGALSSSARHSVKKLAKRVRFHFAIDPKVCPNCGKEEAAKDSAKA
jgi:hypothetical protein